MICGSCGEENAEGAQFCAECGAPVAAPATTPTDPSMTVTGEFGATAIDPTIADAAPLPPTTPGVPPPPPPIAPTDRYAAAAAAGGPPDDGGGQKRALLLIGVVIIVVVAFLGSVGFLLTRSDGDDTADVSSVSPATTAGVPDTTTTTEEATTTTVPTPDSTAPAPGGDGQPEDGDAVEAYCDSAEALGVLIREATTDPQNADLAEITRLTDEITEASQSFGSLTPAEVDRVTACSNVLAPAP